MEIIVIKKTTFDVIQINNVSSITKTSSTWTIVAGTTSTYSTSDYDVRIIG